MKLDVPFYAQSTSFTCDPACLMMVLKYFDTKINLSHELEFDIWRESYGIGIPGCMPQGLAYSALLRGLNSTVVCKKKGFVQISRKLATGENRKISLLTSKNLLEKAKLKGMNIIDKDPDLKIIENTLNKNQIPIVMVHMNLLHRIDSPHWVVVTGVDDKNIWINNPYSKNGKNVKVSKTDFLSMMDDLKKYSKIEKRMLLVSKEE